MPDVAENGSDRVMEICEKLLGLREWTFGREMVCCVAEEVVRK